LVWALLAMGDLAAATIFLTRHQWWAMLGTYAVAGLAFDRMLRALERWNGR